MEVKNFLIVVLLIVIALLIYVTLPPSVRYFYAKSVEVEDINKEPLEFNNSLVRVVGTVLFSYFPHAVIEDNGSVIFLEGIDKNFTKGNRIEVIGKVVTVPVRKTEYDRWLKVISTKLVEEKYPITKPTEMDPRDVGPKNVGQLLKMRNLTLAKVYRSGGFYLLRFSELGLGCFLRENETSVKFLQGARYDIVGFPIYIVSQNDLFIRIIEISLS